MVKKKIDKKKEVKVKQAISLLNNTVKRSLSGEKVSCELAGFSSMMADYSKLEGNHTASKEFKNYESIFRIFAKAEEEKQYLSQDDLRCPICNNPINWFKNVGSTHYRGVITLLAECWSGEVNKEMPRHLFVIKLIRDNLPQLDLTEEGGRNSSHD